MPFALIDHWLAPPPDSERVKWLTGTTYAHRGLHGARFGAGAVENSPTAFAQAIGRGLGIECDVQLSADGGAVVFHDWALDRLTAEAGPVSARTTRELEGIALSGSEAGSEAGSEDCIPSLKSFLAQVSGQAPLLIEVKSGRDTSVGAFCSAIRADLASYDGPVAIMSFDPRIPRWFAIHAPDILRGLVVTEGGGRGWQGQCLRRISLWQSRAQFLVYDIRDLPSPFAASQRMRGLPLLTWTVRSPELLARARLHADAHIAEAGGIA